MIYLPLVGFLLGVAWLVWQGFREKTEYLRAEAEEQQKEARSERAKAAEAMNQGTRSQGQTPEPAQLFGGRGQKETSQTWQN